MKKGIVFILSLILVISMFVTSVNAATSEKKIEPEALGVKKIGTTAKPEDYNGTGVVNLRCAHSNWDSAQEYLWLISDWTNQKQKPGSLLIGEVDMAQVKKIAFDYVTDGGENMANNKVSFTKDAEGKEVLAKAQITEATSPLKNPISLEMEIIDKTYKGNVYVFIEYSTRMFVGNIVITIDDAPPVITEPNTTTEPETTTNPQTSDNSILFVTAAILTLSAVIVKKRVGFVL